jgi:hypothetical protein
LPIVSDDLYTIEAGDGQTFTAGAAPDLTAGRTVAFFIRPEAIIIEPEPAWTISTG